MYEYDCLKTSKEWLAEAEKYYCLSELSNKEKCELSIKLSIAYSNLGLLETKIEEPKK